MRAIARLTGASKNTIVKFLRDAGEACAALPGRDAARPDLQAHPGRRDLVVRRDEAEERPGRAQGRVRRRRRVDLDGHRCRYQAGRVVAAGRPHDGHGQGVHERPGQRLANRVQITSDGHKAYLEAVEEAFGIDVDYAQLVKIYGEAPEAQKRYSPAECVGCKRENVTGSPDPDHISTSYAERANLTMRMRMRRFTRLTNAFSKDAENHAHSIAIHFMHYNFARIHQTLRVSPGHGCWRDRQAVGAGRHRGDDRCRRTAAGQAGAVQEAGGMSRPWVMPASWPFLGPSGFHPHEWEVLPWTPSKPRHEWFSRRRFGSSPLARREQSFRPC